MMKVSLTATKGPLQGRKFVFENAGEYSTLQSLEPRFWNLYKPHATGRLGHWSVVIVSEQRATEL